MGGNEKGVQFGEDVDFKEQKGPRKRNTGFLSADILEKVMQEHALSSQDGVKFAPDEKEDAPSGPKKRNTGYVSAQALQALILDDGSGKREKDTRNSCGEIFIPSNIKRLAEED